jgi:hypothetical protein
MGRPGYYLLRQRIAGMHPLRAGRQGHHQGGNPDVRGVDTTAMRIDISHASTSTAPRLRALLQPIPTFVEVMVFGIFDER